MQILSTNYEIHVFAEINTQISIKTIIHGITTLLNLKSAPHLFTRLWKPDKETFASELESHQKLGTRDNKVCFKSQISMWMVKIIHNYTKFEL